jgi:hypothetical protein
MVLDVEDFEVGGARDMQGLDRFSTRILRGVFVRATAAGQPFALLYHSTNR